MGKNVKAPAGVDGHSYVSTASALMSLEDAKEKTLQERTVEDLCAILDAAKIDIDTQSAITVTQPSTFVVGGMDTITLARDVNTELHARDAMYRVTSIRTCGEIDVVRNVWTRAKHLEMQLRHVEIVDFK